MPVSRLFMGYQLNQQEMTDWIVANFPYTRPYYNRLLQPYLATYNTGQGIDLPVGIARHINSAFIPAILDDYKFQEHRTLDIEPLGQYYYRVGLSLVNNLQGDKTFNEYLQELDDARTYILREVKNDYILKNRELMLYSNLY